MLHRGRVAVLSDLVGAAVVHMYMQCGSCFLVYLWSWELEFITLMVKQSK